MLKKEIVDNLTVLSRMSPKGFKSLYELGVEIGDARGSNSKKEFLEGVRGILNDEEVSALFNLMFNNFYRYGISSDNILKALDVELGDLYEDIEELNSVNYPLIFITLAEFVRGDISKTELLQRYKRMLPENNLTIVDLLFCLLDQDWGVGISISTINKVLGDIVPVFTITRAVSLEADDIDTLEGTYRLEAKLDGTRDFLIVSPNPKYEADIYCMSRNGRLLDIPEATQDILNLVGKYPAAFVNGLVLDGELTIKDSILSDDRTSITGMHNSAIALKSGKNSKLGIDWSQGVSFNAFDILSYDEFFKQWDTKDLNSRRVELENLLSLMPLNCIKLHVSLEVVLPRDLQVVTDFYVWILGEGGEGIILKEVDYAYSFDKNNSGWYKVKDVNTCELKVIGYQLSQDPLLPGALGALICETYDHLVVEIGSGFSLKDRGYESKEVLNGSEYGEEYVLQYTPLKDYDIENWVGKIIEAKYFCVTHTKEVNNNSLFLPRVFTEEDRAKFKRDFGVEYSIIREDKTEADKSSELVGYRA
jgi:hypothetical protein